MTNEEKQTRKATICTCSAISEIKAQIEKLKVLSREIDESYLDDNCRPLESGYPYYPNGPIDDPDDIRLMHYGDGLKTALYFLGASEYKPELNLDYG